MCFHKWGKWEQYREEYTFTNKVTLQQAQATELRQKRYCLKCNKMQDELIKKG
jgi:hypothetical protein